MTRELGKVAFVAWGCVALGAAWACSSDETSSPFGEADTGVSTPGAEGGPTFGTVDGGTTKDGATSDAKPSAPNLVPNGDFSQGNLLFGSDYAFATTNTVEGQYTVSANVPSFNGLLVNAADHTNGSGQMFVGNGKATPDRVWFTSQPIAVTPNTQYYFEAWVSNLCCASGLGDGIHPVGPSALSFYANDQLLGTRTSTQLGVWEGLTTNWNSGSATTVTLKLVNANTEALGNDFAVDDIYLGTETSIPTPK